MPRTDHAHLDAAMIATLGTLVLAVIKWLAAWQWPAVVLGLPWFLLAWLSFYVLAYPAMRWLWRGGAA